MVSAEARVKLRSCNVSLKLYRDLVLNTMNNLIEGFCQLADFQQPPLVMAEHSGMRQRCIASFLIVFMNRSRIS